MTREEKREKLHYLQMSPEFMNEPAIKRLMSIKAKDDTSESLKKCGKSLFGDTMFMIYLQAHCVALKNNGILRIDKDVDIAEEIGLLIGFPEEMTPLVQEMICHCLKLKLISIREDDDANVVLFNLTERFTRCWTKEAIWRREKHKRDEMTDEKIEKSEYEEENIDMTTETIKAIPTEYNGDMFRSKLEAQWAVVFDSLGIRYEYEPEGFELEDGTKYEPDFYFPDQDTYGEVKPDRSGAIDELAGKALKFVESGKIERLIVFTNIPAATKKDPVWWLPIAVKNPFVPRHPDMPLNNLMISRVCLGNGYINLYDVVSGLESAKLTPQYFKAVSEYMSYFSPGKSGVRKRKNAEAEMKHIFLTATPTRDLEYYQKHDGCSIPEPISSSETVMHAFRKGRQAKFDHGQTPVPKNRRQKKRKVC